MTLLNRKINILDSNHLFTVDKHMYSYSSKLQDVFNHTLYVRRWMFLFQFALCSKSTKEKQHADGVIHVLCMERKKLIIEWNSFHNIKYHFFRLFLRVYTSFSRTLLIMLCWQHSMDKYYNAKENNARMMSIKMLGKHLFKWCTNKTTDVCWKSAIIVWWLSVLMLI